MNKSKGKMKTKPGKKVLNPFAVKQKKRSLVERELETNMTARITSPVTIADGVSTSRYGRARRIKAGYDNKNVLGTLISPKSENTPVKVQSPITKQVVSSPYKTETPKKALKTSLDNIDNTYQAKKTLNYFKSESLLPKSPRSAKKFSKVYIRKDLIQNRDDDDDDDVILIKDLFPPKSGKKQYKIRDGSLEKHKSFIKQNGYLENASVVKALDFDDNKRDSAGNKRDSSGNKRDSSVNKRVTSGNKRDSSSNNRDADGNQKSPQSVPNIELVKGVATCFYQVGDLVWARMGTFPFWPCIITREPGTEMFIRKKCKYSNLGTLPHQLQFQMLSR